MTENTIIGVLLTANTALVGAVVYLYKQSRKDMLAMLTECRKSLDANTKVLEKVLQLLTNWRGH